MAGLAAHYDIKGPDDGPTIVFVHGTRVNRAAWSTVVPYLSRDFRCVTLDLPGHGAGGEPWPGVPAAADHVAAVVREVAGRARPVMVGLSLGGYVAIEAAARHPGLFSGLVLSGCSADPVGWRSWSFRGYAALLRYTPVPVLRFVSDATLRAAFGRELTARLRAGGDGIVGGRAAVASLVGRRFSERLREFDGPVVIVNGARDPFFRPPAARWAGDRPHTRRVVIRGAGHLVSLDRPAAFAGVVRAFAERVGGRDGGSPRLY